MFFCSKCGSLYNITKDCKSRQLGGKIKKGIERLFEKHQNGEALEEGDLDNISYSDLLQNDRYNSLPNKARESMRSWIRSFDKQWPVEQEEPEGVDAVITEFFVCKSCQNSEPIKPGTIICNENFGFDDGAEIEDYASMIYDQSLFRTKVYVCPNKKCPTRKDPSIREACITKNHLHQCVYICTVCTTDWISTA